MPAVLCWPKQYLSMQIPQVADDSTGVLYFITYNLMIICSMQRVCGVVVVAGDP